LHLFIHDTAKYMLVDFGGQKASFCCTGAGINRLNQREQSNNPQKGNRQHIANDAPPYVHALQGVADLGH
jgi:hypothetical protein